MPHRVQAYLVAFAGVLLCALAIPYTVYSGQAALSFGLYHKAKWGEEGLSPGEVLSLCTAAQSHYTHSHDLAVYAAQVAFEAGMSAEGDEAERLLETAEAWCDLGLKLNFYRPELRELKAQLLAFGSPREGVAYWERYLDWQFWEPRNHLVMVDLCLQAGDFERAEAALAVLAKADQTDYATARRWIEEARKAEAASTP